MDRTTAERPKSFWRHRPTRGEAIAIVALGLIVALIVVACWGYANIAGNRMFRPSPEAPKTATQSEPRT